MASIEKYKPEIDQDTDRLMTMPRNEERVKSLCLKLKEYKQKEEQDPSFLDAKYKKMILEDMLKKGITSYNELYKKIPPENKAIFDNAFDAVESYAINGSEDLFGATVPPKSEKNG
jgi:translation initiation factor 2 alpha subunit (eIF-2alpha)